MNIKMKISVTTLALTLLLAALVAGCGPSSDHGHDHGPSHGHSHDHGHQHSPPHGGTPVVLGNEAYHIEFVHDREAGRMHAYILDGHMERFVRVPAESFEVAARHADSEEILVFRPANNPATGEKPGDASQFTAESEWLKEERQFEGLLKSLTIRGREYATVTFRFPKGTK
jgi:hypothetical protein